MNDTGLTIVMYLVAIYLIVAQILMLYFWYIIAQIHGFAYTIFIGPFEAEIKGLLWPFFI